MEIKDKPNSMSVRDWITKKIATGIIIPEMVIKEVISHQFDGANEALLTNNSIEISGFGKFYYNEKKANKEIHRCKVQKAAYEKILDDKTTTEKKRLSVEVRLKSISVKLERLIEKQNGKSKGDI